MEHRAVVKELLETVFQSVGIVLTVITILFMASPFSLLEQVYVERRIDYLHVLGKGQKWLKKLVLGSMDLKSYHIITATLYKDSKQRSSITTVSIKLSFCHHTFSLHQEPGPSETTRKESWSLP